MSLYEDPLHRTVAKTRRVRPAFRPQQSRQAAVATLNDKANQWLKHHPWSILGACAGLFGLLGYRLGIRS